MHLEGFRGVRILLSTEMETLGWYFPRLWRINCCKVSDTNRVRVQRGPWATLYVKFRIQFVAPNFLLLQPSWESAAALEHFRSIFSATRYGLIWGIYPEFWKSVTLRHFLCMVKFNAFNLYNSNTDPGVSKRNIVVWPTCRPWDCICMNVPGDASN